VDQPAGTSCCHKAAHEEQRRCLGRQDVRKYSLFRFSCVLSFTEFECSRMQGTSERLSTFRIFTRSRYHRELTPDGHLTDALPVPQNACAPCSNYHNTVYVCTRIFKKYTLQKPSNGSAYISNPPSLCQHQRLLKTLPLQLFSPLLLIRLCQKVPHFRHVPPRPCCEVGQHTRCKVDIVRVGVWWGRRGV
jgi:hypothetical protein